MRRASSHEGTVEPLPEGWGLAGLGDADANGLRRAWSLLESDPLGAARLAESLFPGVRDRADMAPWLAFQVATSGRIQSLSAFDGLDPLLAFFDERRATLDAEASVAAQLDACFFGALVFRQPDHPRIDEWAERCEQAFQSDGAPLARLSAGNYLLLHRIWRGDLLGAEVLCSRMGVLRDATDDVRCRLLCYSMSSMIHRLFLQFTACEEDIAQGLELGRRTGVHYWDSHFHMQGAFLALSREQLSEAREWLDMMERSAPPEHYLDRSGYHYGRGWLHSLRDEHALALRHAREAVELGERSGAVFPLAVTLAGLGQLLIEQGRVASGFYHMARARKVGKRMGSEKPVQFFRGLLQAHIAFRLGLRERGKGALQKALGIGREQHYLNYPWWRGDLVAGLCAEALAEGIEVDYVREIIRRRRLKPPPDVHARQSWYWPLHVRLLGRTRATVDGVAVELGPRATDLLVALASMGEGGRWVSRERLADALWPDSEGDRALATLDTSVHRLRRQLGLDGLVLSRPGALALDPRQCWVDYWWVLHVLDTERPEPAMIDELVATVGELTRAAEEGETRLFDEATLVRRISAKIGQMAEEGAVGPSRAQLWLETLVSHMPDSEAHWQRLIRFYRSHGMGCDASDALRRCREALRAAQGREPSAETVALAGGR